MIELERTYLIKYIPEGLDKCKSKEIIDIYIPKEEEHPKLRLRKNGDKFELTKKEPICGNDSSEQKEDTIILNKKEYIELSKIPGKRLHKIRYYYNYRDYIAEIDIFLEDLYGLIVVDFEFDNKKDKDDFITPDFCLADVTQELAIAGGILCGKSYEDIKEDIDKYNYKKQEFVIL